MAFSVRPCPFCGGTAEIGFPVFVQDTKIVFVRCRIQEEGGCGAVVSYRGAEADLSAIAARWNARAVRLDG